MILQGDCLIRLKELPENSIDAIVTDPPYGLEFMGKDWDRGVPGVHFWQEMIRVLKPGGHLLAFGGTRTYHRMASAIEDAGFEIRDMIEWVTGSGFPKSLNLNKALLKKCTCGNMEVYDKQRTKQNTKHNMRPVSETDLSQKINTTKEQGEVLQSELSEQSVSLSRNSTENVWEGQSSLEGGSNVKTNSRELSGNDLSEMPEGVSANGEERRLHNATQVSDGSTLKQITDENGSSASHRSQSEQQQDRKPCAFCEQLGTQETRRLYEKTYGVGSALKPAHEPICLARKPLSEKTLVDNFIKYGTGGLNIDESRVETDEELNYGTGKKSNVGFKTSPQNNDRPVYDGQGRFPANLIHDNSEEVKECFPESKSGAMNGTYKNTMMKGQPGVRDGKEIHLYQEASEGNASRFFKSIVYIPKASKSERNKGLDSTGTVKYNSGICKEENMVAVELLKRVMSESIVRWGIDEYGENITGQCQLDTLSTTRTIINKTIELKILNSLMHSLTNESIQDANLEMENGGSLAGNVESLKMWLLDITKGKTELALGVSDVALKTLLKANEEENWKPATNFHATVKPIALMEYLIKMVTREGQTVLDPFMGSGSTGVACKNLLREFIGIEMVPEYAELARRRIDVVSDRLL